MANSRDELLVKGGACSLVVLEAAKANANALDRVIHELHLAVISQL